MYIVKVLVVEIMKTQMVDFLQIQFSLMMILIMMKFVADFLIVKQDGQIQMLQNQKKI